MVGRCGVRERLKRGQAGKLAALIRERAEPTPTQSQHKSVAAELRELAELRDSGILTAKEFDDQKRRLLGG